MARQPGPKYPENYPAPPGSNYQYYGEQPGYIYNPYTDKYTPDPKVQGEYLESKGLGPEKPPGLTEAILPIAATAGALYGAKELAPQIVGSYSEGTGLLGGAKDLFGAGSAAAQTPIPATPELVEASRGLAESAAGLDAGGAWYNTAPEMGSANQIVSGLAALHGGYNAFRDIKEGGSGRHGLTQAGAGIGNIIGGPVGGLIGAGIGNIAGYGMQGSGWKNKAALLLTAPILLPLKMGDKDRWQTEAKRWDKLVEDGLATEEERQAAWERAQASRGRSKADLVREAEETGGNVDFARTRDESYLRPDDIAGFADVQEQARRRGMDPREVAARGLAAGAIREHNGTITGQWDKVDFSTPLEQLQKPWEAALGEAQKRLDPNGQLPGGQRTPVSKPGTQVAVNSGLLANATFNPYLDNTPIPPGTVMEGRYLPGGVRMPVNKPGTEPKKSGMSIRTNVQDRLKRKQANG